MVWSKIHVHNLWLYILFTRIWTLRSFARLNSTLTLTTSRQWSPPFLDHLIEAHKNLASPNCKASHYWAYTNNGLINYNSLQIMCNSLRASYSSYNGLVKKVYHQNDTCSFHKSSTDWISQKPGDNGHTLFMYKWIILIISRLHTLNYHT